MAVRSPRLAAATLLAAALLAGCVGGDAPQPAQFVAPAPAVADLDGALRAHYNLLPTLSLGEAVARQYGIARAPGSALLVVALRRVDGEGVEHPADGRLQAQARDLSGRRAPIALRPVSTGDYVDHIGVLPVSPRDVVRIDVQVDADGRRQSFDFQRHF
ncbi:hypothetical protein B1992_01980 [Pseudoxanthomonas broegbernensis]|uniref:DUF4426 domain-containing protein n=1 Tax=Pseudoxanthomonas broegbernensis TaxID=83619 RepID=A0A7V8K8J4_9GAMM|nr:hypothetical protein B1992_01980 [Pseudoxanthomonas broegbernensis]